MTVARGGVAGNQASSTAIAGTPRDGEWFDCTICKKGHSWPDYSTQRPVSKTWETFGGNKIATHLVKPEDEGDSDNNGVEPEVSLVQMEMEVGIASNVFATERSDKPPSSLELYMAQLALEETDAGYVPAHFSCQNVEREPNSAYEPHGSLTLALAVAQAPVCVAHETCF